MLDPLLRQIALEDFGREITSVATDTGERIVT